VSDHLPADDANELEAKKRARRRLVGAAALIALAIVLLPLAMNSDAPPAAPDMQVSFPSQGHSSLADADAGKVDIEPDVAVPGPEFPPPEPPPALADPSPTEPPPAEPPPAASVPPAPAVLAPKPPPAGSPPSVRNARAARKDEAARALALLNGVQEASPLPAQGKSKDKNKGKIYIQAASFSDAGRAAALAAKLKKQGFAAYAEKAGKVNRVRIGPLERAEAERVAARLEAKGHGALLLSR
jgi:DedD protein